MQPKQRDRGANAWRSIQAYLRSWASPMTAQDIARECHVALEFVTEVLEQAYSLGWVERWDASSPDRWELTKVGKATREPMRLAAPRPAPKDGAGTHQELKSTILAVLAAEGELTSGVLVARLGTKRVYHALDRLFVEGRIGRRTNGTEREHVYRILAASPSPVARIEPVFTGAARGFAKGAGEKRDCVHYDACLTEFTRATSGDGHCPAACAHFVQLRHRAEASSTGSSLSWVA